MIWPYPIRNRAIPAFWRALLGPRRHGNGSRPCRHLNAGPDLTDLQPACCRHLIAKFGQSERAQRREGQERAVVGEDRGAVGGPCQGEERLSGLHGLALRDVLDDGPDHLLPATVGHQHAREQYRIAAAVPADVLLLERPIATVVGKGLQLFVLGRCIRFRREIPVA